MTNRHSLRTAPRRLPKEPVNASVELDLTEDWLDHVVADIGVVPGVNVAEIPSVDFFAPRVLSNNAGYADGVDVGEVTNWTTSSQDWHMWLYCTSDKSRGYLK